MSVHFPTDVEVAADRIRAGVRRTPLEPSPWLGAAVPSSAEACEVFLKLECWQRTGSFKLRGATNALRARADEAARGVVAASTGNHGLAVATAAADLGVPAIVYAPETADAAKLDAVERAGAQVRRAGGDCVEAEAAARSFSVEQDLPYISPYNDPLVCAGQGTIGLELLEDLPDVDAVFIAVGGGGLIGGVGGYLKSMRPEVRVVGCSPEHSPVLAASVAAGRILDMPCDPTLSDATAGGVEQGSITFELCRQVIDQWVNVDEDEIAACMRGVLAHHHLLVEGAAAVAIAGFQRLRAQHAGERVAIVLCGANVDPRTLRDVLVAGETGA